MAYTTIDCFGSQLEVQDWLAPLWPYELALEDWPTFCGAGGIGDLFVPDELCGVNISPACFVHDIDFAVLPREWWEFQQANNRLYCNMIAVLNSNIQNKKQLAKAKREARWYWIGVSVFGWKHFTPENPNPWSNPVVRDRLNRLDKAKRECK